MIMEQHWFKCKDNLPDCPHATDGGRFSDMCVCLCSSGELYILALNEQYDEDEGTTYYWGTYDEIFDEEIYGEIIAWLPLPPTDGLIKEWEASV